LVGGGEGPRELHDLDLGFKGSLDDFQIVQESPGENLRIEMRREKLRKLDREIRHDRFASEIGSFRTQCARGSGQSQLASSR
jgi:hypothetical protein